MTPPGAASLAAALEAARLVDLTQLLGPATALWPGSSPFVATTVATYERDQCYARELAFPEHAGTHLDAPSHFIPGQARVHELDPTTFLRPLVKLDVRPWVGEDETVSIGREVIEELEARDGAITPGVVVVVHTGWDAHVSNADRYLGPNGTTAFPGLAASAAELLVERRVAGLGIDTLSTDVGGSPSQEVHLCFLPSGAWQLEGLVNLAALPPRGAWIVVAPLNLVDGSGTPARVFAIVPAS
ncbi:MAG: cyclase family protein [Gaiellales bacterium]